MCVINNSLKQVLAKYPISTFCAAPTTYRMMQLEPSLSSSDLSSVRHFVGGGEPFVSFLAIKILSGIVEYVLNVADCIVNDTLDA